MVLFVDIQKKAELELNDEPYYTDDGCKAATACLSCRLSRCKHDDPTWYRMSRRMSRDLRRYAEMERDSLTVEAAARRFGVTIRTIWRIKARCLNQLGDMSIDDLRIFGAMEPAMKRGSKDRGGGLDATPHLPRRHPTSRSYQHDNDRIVIQRRNTIT